jgi:RNA polymerase sigma-70 factor, ECF subfamily
MEDVVLTRVRAGDGDAFRELTEPFRRELQLHCYRILDSVQDAEDAVQETLLAAWRGIGQFEGRTQSVAAIRPSSMSVLTTT